MAHKDVIRESNNYKMFEPMSFNRNVTRTKELEQSFRKHGWIKAYPMHVIQGASGKYTIKAGNHRFYVAQKLGIPVRYVVCEDDVDIFELEGATRHWQLNDYLISQCRAGNDEYIAVKNYCEETGIATGLAVSILMGQTAGSGGYAERFKGGRFKVNNKSNHAEIMREMVLLCKARGIEFYNKSLFVHALSRVVYTKEVDLKRLKSKINKFSHIMTKRANLEQYLDMLDELYNWKSASKIPVKFLSHEAAKQRCAVAAR